MTVTLGPTNGIVFPDSTSTPKADFDAAFGSGLIDQGTTVGVQGKTSLSGDNGLTIPRPNFRGWTSFSTAPATSPSVEFISRTFNYGDSNAYITTSVSVSAGDLVVCFHMSTNSNANIPPTCSGETFSAAIAFGYQSDSNYAAGMCYYFVASSGGTKTITGDRSHSTAHDAFMYTYVIRGQGSPIVENAYVFQSANTSNMASQSVSFTGSGVMALYAICTGHDDGGSPYSVSNNGSSFNNEQWYGADSSSDWSSASGYLVAEGSSFNTPTFTRSGSDSASAVRLMVVNITGFDD